MLFSAISTLAPNGSVDEITSPFISFENYESIFLKKGLKPAYILLLVTAPMIMICNCYSGFILQNYTYLDNNNWLFINVVLWARLIFVE